MATILGKAQFQVSRASTEFASLDAAVAALGASNAVLTLAPGDIKTLTGDVTIPANVTLSGQGGVIATNGHTLTVNGPVVAGNYQLFDASGGGQVDLVQVDNIYAAWWGEGQEAVQAAIDAAERQGRGTVIADRSFTVTSTLNVGAGVVLWVREGVKVSVRADVHVFRMRLNARVRLDGEVNTRDWQFEDLDANTFSSSVFYYRGEDGFSTGGHNSGTSGTGEVVMQFSGYAYFFHSDARGLYFTRHTGLRISRAGTCIGFFADSTTGTFSAINAHTFDLDFNTFRRMVSMRRAGLNTHIDGNVFRGQVQINTVCEYLAQNDGRWNIYDFVIWDSNQANTGEVVAATPTTATLKYASSEANAVYVGATVHITSGTGSGQARKITAYDPATKTVTVPAWDTVPDATSTYYIDSKLVRLTGTGNAVWVTGLPEGYVDLSGLDGRGNRYELQFASRLAQTVSVPTPAGGRSAVEFTGMELSEVAEIVARKRYAGYGIMAALRFVAEAGGGRGGIAFFTNNVNDWSVDATEAARLTREGDWRVDHGDMEVLAGNKGLILKAPNGTRYRVRVDNAGALTTTAL